MENSKMSIRKYIPSSQTMDPPLFTANKQTLICFLNLIKEYSTLWLPYSKPIIYKWQ